MYRFRPTWALSLCPMLSGCGTDPIVCTASFETITAVAVDGAGQPLSDVTVTDTVRRTGAVLNVTANTPSIGPGVTIFSDGFLQTVRASGDEVIVVATAAGRSGSADYRFGSDGCHVRKLAGPDTLVIP